MISEWYAQKNSFIMGPFSPTQIFHHYQRGRFDLKDTKLWWDGVTDWVPLEEWIKEYLSTLVLLEERDSESWNIRTIEYERKSITIDECLEIMCKCGDLAEFSHASVPDKWSRLSSNKVLQGLVNSRKRKHLRIPINDVVKVSGTSAPNSEYYVKTRDIGLGGVSVMYVGDLWEIGDKIRVELPKKISPNGLLVDATIVSHCEKLYATGLLFDELTYEAQNELLEYLSRVSKSNEEEVN